MAETQEPVQAEHSETDSTAETILEKEETKLTRNQRFYALHRAERLAKQKELYANRPDVIAKREEHARKKAEKEAAKIAAKEEEKRLKAIERERQREEKLRLALATRKPVKST